MGGEDDGGNGDGGVDGIAVDANAVSGKKQKRRDDLGISFDLGDKDLGI